MAGIDKIEGDFYNQEDLCYLHRILQPDEDQQKAEFQSLVKHKLDQSYVDFLNKRQQDLEVVKQKNKGYRINKYSQPSRMNLKKFNEYEKKKNEKFQQYEMDDSKTAIDTSSLTVEQKNIKKFKEQIKWIQYVLEFKGITIEDLRTKYDYILNADTVWNRSQKGIKYRLADVLIFETFGQNLNKLQQLQDNLKYVMEDQYAHHINRFFKKERSKFKITVSQSDASDEKKDLQAQAFWNLGEVFLNAVIICTVIIDLGFQINEFFGPDRKERYYYFTDFFYQRLFIQASDKSESREQLRQQLKDDITSDDPYELAFLDVLVQTTSLVERKDQGSKLADPQPYQLFKEYVNAHAQAKQDRNFDQRLLKQKNSNTEDISNQEADQSQNQVQMVDSEKSSTIKSNFNSIISNMLIPNFGSGKDQVQAQDQSLQQGQEENSEGSMELDDGNRLANVDNLFEENYYLKKFENLWRKYYPHKTDFNEGKDFKLSLEGREQYYKDMELFKRRLKMDQNDKHLSLPPLYKLNEMLLALDITTYHPSASDFYYLPRQSQLEVITNYHNQHPQKKLKSIIIFTDDYKLVKPERYIFTQDDVFEQEDYDFMVKIVVEELVYLQVMQYVSAHKALQGNVIFDEDWDQQRVSQNQDHRQDMLHVNYLPRFYQLRNLFAAILQAQNINVANVRQFYKSFLRIYRNDSQALYDLHLDYVQDLLVDQQKPFQLLENYQFEQLHIFLKVAHMQATLYIYPYLKLVYVKARQRLLYHLVFDWYSIQKVSPIIDFEVNYRKIDVIYAQKFDELLKKESLDTIWSSRLERNFGYILNNSLMEYLKDNMKQYERLGNGIPVTEWVSKIQNAYESNVEDVIETQQLQDMQHPIFIVSWPDLNLIKQLALNSVPIEEIEMLSSLLLEEENTLTLQEQISNQQNNLPVESQDQQGIYSIMEDGKQQASQSNDGIKAQVLDKQPSINQKTNELDGKQDKQQALGSNQESREQQQISNQSEMNLEDFIPEVNIQHPSQSESNLSEQATSLKQQKSQDYQKDIEQQEHDTNQEIEQLPEKDIQNQDLEYLLDLLLIDDQQQEQQEDEQQVAPQRVYSIEQEQLQEQNHQKVIEVQNSQQIQNKETELEKHNQQYQQQENVGVFSQHSNLDQLEQSGQQLKQQQSQEAAALVGQQIDSLSEQQLQTYGKDNIEAQQKVQEDTQQVIDNQRIQMQQAEQSDANMLQDFDTNVDLDLELDLDINIDLKELSKILKDQLEDD